MDARSPDIGEPTTELIRLDQEFSLFDQRFTKREDWEIDKRFYSSEITLQTDVLPDLSFDVATILNFTNKGNNIEPLSDSDKTARGFLDPRLVLYGRAQKTGREVDPKILDRLRVQIIFPSSSFESSKPFYSDDPRQFHFGYFNPREGNFRYPPNYGLILPQEPENAQQIKAKFVLVPQQK